MATTGDDLDFFNRLSGRLEVTLTENPERITERLHNLAAPATARLARIELRLEVFEEEAGAFRALTDDESNRIAFRRSTIHLRGLGERVVQHAAPNGRWFTVRELAAAVEETERQTRGDSEWFGGIDVHHVFFQGIHEGNDGVWTISWGS
jgi:hypothetical protein